MSTAAPRQSVKDTNHSKTDGMRIRDMQIGTAFGVRPERVRSHLKRAAACKGMPYPTYQPPPSQMVLVIRKP